ncbi:MAG: hypothetical protein LBI26_00475 [Holosporales bacterium]|nr:hypothetical protein [Holosporales bacterium]
MLAAFVTVQGQASTVKVSHAGFDTSSSAPMMSVRDLLEVRRDLGQTTEDRSYEPPRDFSTSSSFLSGRETQTKRRVVSIPEMKEEDEEAAPSSSGFSSVPPVKIQVRDIINTITNPETGLGSITLSAILSNKWISSVDPLMKRVTNTISLQIPQYSDNEKISLLEFLRSQSSAFKLRKLYAWQDMFVHSQPEITSYTNYLEYVSGKVDLLISILEKVTANEKP